MTAVVTGVGLALPGVTSIEELLGSRPKGATSVQPAIRLGRKGLRYQDRSTQLALCAGYDALLDSGLLPGPATPPPVGSPPPLAVPAGSIAVVASSNLGNLDSVCEAATVIAEERSSRLVSPILAPRLSSNVVASEVAIRFGLCGPNLMFCNGGSSGLDAVQWAVALLAAGRAQHVLVIGVEPDTAIARRLLGCVELLDGAVGLVLEPASVAVVRGAATRAVLGRFTRAADLAACVATLKEADRPEAWYVPEGPAAIDAALLRDVTRRDLAAGWGAASGALGVLQCAAAVGHFSSGGDGPVLVTAGSDQDDATTGLMLHAPGPDAIVSNQTRQRGTPGVVECG